MAKFLQETVESMAVVSQNSTPEAMARAKDFSEAFRKVRITGEPLKDEEIISLAKQLSDTITLENLPRAQVVSICRYMGINAFGTDNFLRFQIRNRMKRIRSDDEMIDKEGVSDLTYDELVHACNSRGIRSIGAVTRAKLEGELRQWLELHLRSEIPSVLLILSRALTFHEPDMDTEEALQNVIMTLPEHVVDEAKLEVSEAAGDSTNSYKQKLQILERQEDLIAEELEQERVEKENRKPDDISTEAVETLSEAISVLSSPSPATQEKAELEELKDDVENYKEDVSELKELSHNQLDVTKTAKKLENQIDRLISDVETELAKYEMDLGDKNQLFKPDENGQLTVAQLESICKMLKNKEVSQEKLTEILKKFDADGDGKIFVEDIIKLAVSAQDQEGSGVIHPDDPRN